MLLTRPQRKAVKRLYDRNADGAKSYRAFRARVGRFIGLGCICVPWCGMYIGIETDGYTHS